MISMLEFSKMIQIPQVVQAMKEVDIDVFALVDSREFIFREKKELTFDEFMEEVAQFRTSNNCTVKDIIRIRMEIKAMEKKLEKKLSRASMCGSEVDSVIDEWH